MDLSTTANLINAAAVTMGVLFAAAQIRDYRRQRKREAMLELVRSFQSPAVARSLHRINSLPDSATLQEIRDTIGPDGEDDVFLIGLTFETLGILVYRREITLDLIDDFFSGAIIVSWRKLHAFVEEDRRSLDRATVWEWFQWLAERMAEREKKMPAVAAHIAHRSWK
jgi:hypothetical protein